MVGLGAGGGGEFAFSQKSADCQSVFPSFHPFIMLHAP